MISARINFTLLTPLHVGAGSTQFLDDVVQRDSFGLYMISATSIAGALRDFSKDLDLTENKQVIDALFGFAKGDKGTPSILFISDAKLLDYDGSFASDCYLTGKKPTSSIADGLGPYIRDHVRIDKEGVAQQGGKYDEEIVPAGAKFSFEITLDNDWNTKKESEKAEKEANFEACKALFEKILVSLNHSQIAFGGKQNSGYGRIAFNDGDITIRDFDLTTQQGHEAYLNLTRKPTFDANDGGTEITLKSLEQEIIKKNQENTVSGQLSITFESVGPLLIAGVNQNDVDADLAFVSTPYFDYKQKQVTYKQVIPGTSFKGAIAHRVFDIANVLYGDDKACTVIDKMFGAISGQYQGEGHISVLDTELKQSHEVVVQHVAIDRFTGGAVDGALFNEAPIWDKNVEVPLTLYFKKLPIECVKLLAFALLDLADSSLAVGNGVNRGNGRLKLKRNNGSFKDSITCDLYVGHDHLVLDCDHDNYAEALTRLQSLDDLEQQPC